MTVAKRSSYSGFSCAKVLSVAVFCDIPSLFPGKKEVSPEVFLPAAYPTFLTFLVY